MLQSETKIIGCDGANAAVHEGGRFSSCERNSEETVRAWCGLVTTKIHCLSLHLLRPAIIRRKRCL